MYKSTWYEIYDYLSEGLYRFYDKHQENSGKELFDLCKNHPLFVELNPWIRKFNHEWNRHSIDPIHVFASFNYNKINSYKRVELINFYFDILRVDVSPLGEYDVDFDGIPSPRIDKIVVARTLEAQNQIWNFFVTFYSAKKNKEQYDFISQSNIFKIIKQWYGVAIPSLTIFLFLKYISFFFRLQILRRTLLS